MHRWIATLSLLSLSATLAAAQSQDDCLKVKKISTSYNALRQGREFDVRVTFSASGCALSMPTSGQRLPSRVLLKGSPGLQVQPKGAEFGNIERLSEGPSGIYGAHETTLHLRFFAAQDAAPGIQRPTLPFSYETVDKTGQRVTRNTEVEIPIHVVEFDAPVKSLPVARKWNPARIFLIPFGLIQLLFWDGC
jgi:hypothetical protein